MSTDNIPTATPRPGTPVELVLTWTVTDTFADHLPLDALAAATGRSVEALTADPATLRGNAPTRLVDLLAGRQDEDTQLAPDTDVEITRAELVDLPTLADLVDDARKALRAESDADQHTCAGKALAALLAGLRGEEVIGQ